MTDLTEAALLHRALRDAQPIAAPTARDPQLTIDGAYAIQGALVALLEGEGARRVGRKVGLTSAAMQTMLGVDQPDYGVVLDTMLLRAGEPLDASQLIAPRVEAEIAFYLDAPLQGPDVTVDDVLAATSHVSAALEIIDSRVADWKITIADTIADNASSALVLLGERVPIDAVDLQAEAAAVVVGDANVSGTGAAILGHPAEAVAWLARTLAPHDVGLNAGEFVIPGAVAAALPFASGDVIRAIYMTLGELEVPVR
jgi:2-keto-4-pentenoate hydratase